MKNPALKNAQVFKQQKLIAGLPDKVFIIALVVSAFGTFLCVKLGGLMGIGGGLLFAYVVYKPLYNIHQFDLEAWRLYLRALHAPTQFDARYTTEKKLNVIHNATLMSFDRFTQIMSSPNHKEKDNA
uniref:Uncharacterized protein n=1 Tax=Vibrio sp. 23023 TaxID=452803 RepID=A9M4M6_9VIBR|nr:hypothetical protein [Vibrio sp. 23023]ABX76981.1 Conserved hypothetical protein [Vibrio sp. 23023]